MHATGDDARALELWQQAVAVKDDDPDDWLSIGELAEGRPARTPTRAPRTTRRSRTRRDQDMKKKALRALADLALATGDNDAAERLLQAVPRPRSEQRAAVDRARRRDARRRQARRRARELRRRREAARQRPDAPRRGGRRAAARRSRRWARTTRRSPSTAARSSSRRRATTSSVELTGRIIDIYRRKQQLAALLADYEKEWPEGSRGHFEWDTLGKLYEETGAQDKAIAALQKAVAKDADGSSRRSAA